MKQVTSLDIILAGGKEKVIPITQDRAKPTNLLRKMEDNRFSP